MGFCIYNNVAVGAHYLIDKYKYKRIAILDPDVHHGNGVQDIFYDNPKVLYLSTHQYPFYPGTGSEKEKGIQQLEKIIKRVLEDKARFERELRIRQQQETLHNEQYR